MADDPKDSSAAATHFENYLEYTKLGLRKKASEAALALIASLPSFEEKRVWTAVNLHQIPQNGAGRIQHQIFSHIVLPVLRRGYDTNDAEATFLLGTMFRNIRDPLADLGQNASRIDLFRRAYAIDPSSLRYSHVLLAALLDQFDYLAHEWPSGILVDSENIGWLEADIALARRVDVGERCKDRIDEFSEKLRTYVKKSQENRLRGLGRRSKPTQNKLN